MTRGWRHANLEKTIKHGLPWLTQHSVCEKSTVIARLRNTHSLEFACCWFHSWHMVNQSTGLDDPGSDV